MSDEPSAPAADAPPRKRGRPHKEPSRHSWIHARVTAQERARLEAAAVRAEMTLGPYVIAAALGAPQRRGRRRPQVEHAALAQLLGQLGRASGNLNQLAKVANQTGQLPAAEQLEAAVQDIREAARAISRALHPQQRED